MADVGEIIVVPFPDPGHIFPAAELAKQLASRNHGVTLILPPSAAALASSLRSHVRVVELPAPDAASFRDLLAKLLDRPSAAAAPPLCAIVDIMMGHQLLDACRQFGIPSAGFFTSSASSVAIDHASRELSAEDFVLGGTIRIAGFPEEMPLTIADLRRGPPPPPPFSYGHPGCALPPPPGSVTQSTRLFPPGPPPASLPPHGEHNTNDTPPPPPPPPPFGLKDIAAAAAALLFNTCDDLERPFLEYIAAEAKKPVWGVGPLLPAEFWSATAGALVQDGSVRPSRTAAVTEADVLRFLESKPPCSVIYVSFGSVVSPSDAELAELAAALEELERPFIWAVQPGTMRHGPTGLPLGGGPDASPSMYTTELAERAGERGMVIRGWAPQLLILSHRATGAFVTHCGWNSTVEALSCGVPMVTWPVRGDQHGNARLVTRALRVGVAIECEAVVRKGDVTKGIERAMGDAAMRDRAKETARRLFARGFPASSSASLDALLDFVKDLENKNEVYVHGTLLE